MAKREERRKVIELRKQGKTFTEIREKLHVSKSTLTRWLKDYPLTQRQIESLEKNKEKRKYLGIERTRITKARKKQKRLEEVYKKEKGDLLPLSKRELFLSGLFLYWGEGVKGLKYSVSLNNTDPRVVKFYLRWLTESLNIPKEKIRVALHLYKDMNALKEIKYWSKKLKIPQDCFNRPYIKMTNRHNVDHKGFGHGTCGLYVCDTRLKERISLATEAIADYYTGIKSGKLI